MSRGAEEAQRIRSLSDAILSEAGTLPAEVVTWKPAPDVWSVMEILCHVEEFLPYWTAQAVNVVSHPDREWGRNHLDPDRIAAVQKATSRNLADLESNIRALALRSAETIAAL